MMRLSLPNEDMWVCEILNLWIANKLSLLGSALNITLSSVQELLSLEALFTIRAQLFIYDQMSLNLVIRDPFIVYKVWVMLKLNLFVLRDVIVIIDFDQSWVSWFPSPIDLLCLNNTPFSKTKAVSFWYDITWLVIWTVPIFMVVGKRHYSIVYHCQTLILLLSVRHFSFSLQWLQ